jgi:hypothetical protein
MVVALVALFFSLGGNALAAVLITNSNQIQNGVVTGADLANNTVKSVDIGNGAVGTDDIANGSVGQSDIGTGQVISEDVGTDALTATNLAPGSVATSELAAEAVRLDDLDMVYRENAHNHVGTVNNGSCTYDTIPGQDALQIAHLTANSLTMILPQGPPAGWTLIGGFNGSAGNLTIGVCNYSGVNGEAPNMFYGALTFTK